MDNNYKKFTDYNESVFFSKTIPSRKTINDIMESRKAENLKSEIKDKTFKFNMIDEEVGTEQNSYVDTVFHIHQKNPVNYLFFSKENVQNIQNQIKYQVYKKKKIVIDEQSETDILTIMRGIYLEHSKNRKTDYKKQIKELNDLVLEYILTGPNNIFSRIDERIAYLRDISVPYTVMAPPQDVNIRGTKTLELPIGM
jgi:hypothetical protein